MLRAKVKYKLVETGRFRQKLLMWIGNFPVFCYMDSNNYYDSCKSKFFYHTYDAIAAAGCNDMLEPVENNAFFELKEYVNKRKDWIFGYLSYDLKNEIENLTSANYDGIGFPVINFFQPRLVFTIKGKTLEIHYFEDQYSRDEIELLFDYINSMKITVRNIHYNINITARMSKKEYIDAVNSIKTHIYRGDIYEINYCHEYYCENIRMDPLLIYNSLKTISPVPFSCFYRLFDKFLISASPERFIKKAGNKIISQPMKGTIKRSDYQGADESLKSKLRHDPKEIAENIMIVDLVRNDLSKTAAMASVKLEEICGLYSFSHVHQMVSTISALLKSEDDIIDAIKNAFPMGSMTGAPKVKAMELIEKYEKTKRGLFSGAVGYFSPDNDFDFNVVIRSILYNNTGRYLSYMVGSAITAQSVPENEYEECLLKAEAINQVFNLTVKEISNA
jgi:para-aminobenzoate synthetase component 1